MAFLKTSIRRPTFAEVAEAIRDFYADHKLLPRGIKVSDPCVLDWSAKQANGLQKLAPLLQTKPNGCHQMKTVQPLLVNICRFLDSSDCSAKAKEAKQR